MNDARTRKTHRQGGMTLLEVLIAMSLLAVGVAGMISIQVLAMRDEAIAREDNDASRITRAALEQVQRMAFVDVPCRFRCSSPAAASPITASTP